MIQIRRNDFPIQSSFNASYERSILAQAPNELIVNPIKEQLTGHAFTLHPSSATPIALRPLGGVAGGNNAPVIIAPGATYRPGGRPFDAFEWGLPFGWLGGGLALLYIGLDPDSTFDWQSRRQDVLIQRLTLPITADDGSTYANANWPLRFPWRNATLASGLNQGTLPSIDVTPTRTIATLSNPLTAPATMRMIWSDPAGGTIHGIDVDWPGINPAPASVMQPVIQLPAEHLIWGGDTAVLSLKDLSGTGALTGQEVNFYRYAMV